MRGFLIKKIFGLIGMIVVSVETFFLFFPGVFIWNFHTADGSLKSLRLKIFFGCWSANSYEVEKIVGVISVIFVSFLIVTVVAFLLNLLRKNNFFTKLFVFSSIPGFVLLIIITVITCASEKPWGKDGSYVKCDAGFVYYLIILLHIASIVFAFILHFSKDKETVPVMNHTQAKPMPGQYAPMQYPPVQNVSGQTLPIQNAPQQTPVSNTAEEIKQYKELLDQGVITQEEFDAKKKQLLEL